MEKELLQKCNMIAQNASIVARDEIRLFCQIMDWSDADVYFVADDPHGVVSLGDYFFNMSDIHEVVANYQKLLERFGSNEELSNIIIRWYDWSTDYNCEHPHMDWQKVERFNALTKKMEYNLPLIPKGKTCSDKILFRTKEYGTQYGIYDKMSDRFVSYRNNVCTNPSETSYWMEVYEPTDEHYINLSSWLKGAYDLVENSQTK